MSKPVRDIADRESDEMAERRRLMVEEQIRGRGVHDPGVLRAMQNVRRHEFVPGMLREFAYEDSPLPIGGGQTISQPYMVAMMTEALRLRGREQVLEIGTGSGYAAAVLSGLVEHVYTIERIAKLADQAEKTLYRLGYGNVTVICGDGTKGLPRHAPFGAIVVTAGAPHVPGPLREQLEIGGRLVVPVGSDKSYQRLLRVTRSGETDFDEEMLTLVRFVPLIGEEGWHENTGFFHRDSGLGGQTW